MTEESAFPQLGSAPDPGPGRAAIALLSNTDGQLLLQLRDDREGVTHRGLWSLFGGRVEPGETLHNAVVRELEEELGLALPADSLHPFVWLQSDSPGHTRLFLFTARIKATPADIRLGEGAGFGFFTPAQVRELNMPAILKPALDAYFSMG